MSEKTLVVGMGATGLSCVRYLQSQKRSCVVVDSRDNPPHLAEIKRDYPNVTIKTGSFDETLFTHAHSIVLSQGVPSQTPAVQAALKAGVDVISDMALFARANPAPYIAITGTNGKSTVTTLVGEMCKHALPKVAVGGNLGTPVLDLLSDDVTCYVLEVSNFQLDHISDFTPAVACVLNTSPDHLDRYDDYSGYIAAKRKIYTSAKKVVYNRLDSNTIPDDLTHAVSFGLEHPPTAADFGVITDNSTRYLAKGEEPWLPVDTLTLAGDHNLLNVLSAFAIGDAYGLQREDMITALGAFRGLPHRCEVVLRRDGITWVNDSKGTNVGATLAALAGLRPNIEGKMVLIAGGLAKGQDLSPLASACKDDVKLVITIGEAASELASILADVVPLQAAASLEEAVQTARAHATAGDMVLLSPACASFDMFESFAKRGEQFTKLVTEIVKHGRT